jgi:hypothetical protein
MARPTSVLSEFRKWGLDREDLPVLLLIPMAEVAWADGHADAKEIDAIIDRHAPDTGLITGPDAFTLAESARQFLYRKFVYVKPDQELVAKAVRLLGDWLNEMAPADADRVRRLIVAMCFEVAERSGGFLGLFGRISADEARVLRNLFVRLHIELDAPPA